ncbi:MAG: helix-turn-helix transcriptional regulator [Arenimonas sp.]
MRASRLLSILMLLQTRGRMSAPTLAAELEVSQRTILRDIDHLSAAGVPIWSDRGRDGGFQLREGWSTNLTGLTENEAQALFLSGMPSAAAELGLGNASVSARLKMLASLPDELRENAERVNARLHFDPIDWFRAAVPTDHLQTIAHCVWHQRIANMQYESWKGTKIRTIKPLGLVLKAGIWYMVALADDAKEARIYRLSNIHQLDLSETAFRRPKQFDLAEFWKQSTQRFETEIYSDVATLLVSKNGMKKLLELSATVGEAAKKSTVADPNQKGWSKVVVPIESIDHASGQLLGIGIDVQVIGPPALRDRMKALINAIKIYYP